MNEKELRQIIREELSRANSVKKINEASGPDPYDPEVVMEMLEILAKEINRININHIDKAKSKWSPSSYKKFADQVMSIKDTLKDMKHQSSVK